MKISEAIKALEEAKAEHGDIDLFVDSHEVHERRDYVTPPDLMVTVHSSVEGIWAKISSDCPSADSPDAPA